jgi:hypothetical protein
MSSHLYTSLGLIEVYILFVHYMMEDYPITGVELTPEMYMIKLKDLNPETSWSDVLEHADIIQRKYNICAGGNDVIKNRSEQRAQNIKLLLLSKCVTMKEIFEMDLQKKMEYINAPKRW